MDISAAVSTSSRAVLAASSASTAAAVSSVSTAAQGVAQVSVHGNSLRSLRPIWGYKLYSKDGTFLKNGITSKSIPQTRYTKEFMSDKYMESFSFPNRLEAYQWEFQQISNVTWTVKFQYALIMSEEKRIFGCYVSITMATPVTDQQRQDLATEQGRLFRSYIWGDKGICDSLSMLNNESYGKDLKLALFQFYVNPIPMMEQALKEIESYRAKEKSIGIPIIVNHNNFFSQSEEDRYRFLKQSILQKLDLLEEVVKKKKLDTNMVQLKKDLQKIL